MESSRSTLEHTSASALSIPFFFAYSFRKFSSRFSWSIFVHFFLFFLFFLVSVSITWSVPLLSPRTLITNSRIRVNWILSFRSWHLWQLERTCSSGIRTTKTKTNVMGVCFCRLRFVTQPLNLSNRKDSHAATGMQVLTLTFNVNECPCAPSNRTMANWILRFDSGKWRPVLGLRWTVWDLRTPQTVSFPRNIIQNIIRFQFESRDPLSRTQCGRITGNSGSSSSSSINVRRFFGAICFYAQRVGAAVDG